MKLDGKQVLVTGGAGFIGSHLVDVLMEKGCRVRVLDNLANGREENMAHHQSNSRFEFLKGTITDPFYVAKAMQGVDVVFHLACLGVRHSIQHPFENHRVNAEGSLIVLEEAYKAGVQRFVYCSTSEVYGTAEYVPMKEDHPTHPCTVYGGSKLAGEAYARAYYKTYGFPTVVIRPFNTFGPRSHHEGDAGELIPKSIVRALNHQDVVVFGDGSQTRDFTYVEDSARGLAEAAMCDALIGKTLNMGSHFEVSIRDVAQKILDLTSAEAHIDFQDGRPGDVLRLFADATEFNRLTGWQSTVSFDDGLLKTIAWFKSRPEGVQALLRHEKARNWV